MTQHPKCRNCGKPITRGTAIHEGFRGYHKLWFHLNGSNVCDKYPPVTVAEVERESDDDKST